MQFKNLNIENFLSIGSARIDISNRGLMLIQGRNLENGGASSNGSGKSTLVDSLFWCLYGRTARGVTTDDVINDTIGKDCRVSLTVEDGADAYVIARHRKHHVNKNRLTLKHNGTDITYGTDKQTQEAVNRIVGSSESVFANSVYAGQEAMPDLPSKTDKDLKALVEEAAGIDRLSEAYQAQLKKANLVKREVEAHQGKVDTADTVLEHQRIQLKSYHTADEQWAESKGEKIKAIKLEAAEIKKRYAAMKPSQLKADLEAAKAQLNDTLARIAATDGEREEQRKLAVEKSKAESAVAVAHSEAKRLGEEAKKAKTLFDTADSSVGTPCKSCGKPYEQADVAGAKAQRKKELAAAVSAFKEAKQKLQDARDRAVSASDALGEFERAMTDVNAERSSESKTRSLIGDLEGKAGQAAALKADYDAKVKQFTTLRDEESPYAKMIESQKEEIAKAEASLADLNDALAKIKHRHGVCVKAAEVLSAGGVRAHILDHVTPILNDRTSHYLGQLSEGEIDASWQTISLTKAGELREKFAIKVTNTKGAKSFGGLSGGEKRKVRIATAMALQDLVASRSAKSLPLFIFDEIDHALDADGLERLMSIMKEKATKSGTVLVISHNDLNHYISDSITVIKEDGFSRVEE
ncbi:AAA family ATPase [Cobetia sp. SIMBA_158]|uniref:AAA family ATPase n=2 Tax=Pseudomonadati TaxID=3379134 RepID=UPI0039809BD9